jgi:starch phosphorylase
MIRAPAATSSGAYVYGCSVTGQRPATDYTPRVIPHFDGVAVPLEAGRILWQR